MNGSSSSMASLFAWLGSSLSSSAHLSSFPSFLISFANLFTLLLARGSLWVHMPCVSCTSSLFCLPVLCHFVVWLFLRVIELTCIMTGLQFRSGVGSHMCSQHCHFGFWGVRVCTQHACQSGFQVFPGSFHHLCHFASACHNCSFHGGSNFIMDISIHRFCSS
jgi:hypothetical protein